MAGDVDVERAPPSVVVERIDGARRREHADVAHQEIESAELRHRAFGERRALRDLSNRVVDQLLDLSRCRRTASRVAPLANRTGARACPIDRPSNRSP